MPIAAKERLVAMLAQRKIPLIEDDLYGDLHFRSRAPARGEIFRRERSRDAVWLIFRSRSRVDIAWAG